MFCVLGELEFELLNGPTGWEMTEGEDYAEHALVEGKPRLQWLAPKLNEISITIGLHAWFCVPDERLDEFRAAMQGHQALALVLGNGTHKGYYVIAELKHTMRHALDDGTATGIEATLSLKEYANQSTAQSATTTAPAVEDWWITSTTTKVY